MRRSSFAGAMRIVGQKFASLGEQMRQRMLRKLFPRADEFGEDGLKRSIYRQLGKVDGYTPQRYDGAVLLFRSHYLQTGRFHDPTMGWGQYVARLTVQETPGDHDEMFSEPAVEHVATALTKLFNNAEP